MLLPQSLNLLALFLHRLKSHEPTEYKLLSLAYKVLTTTLRTYLQSWSPLKPVAILVLFRFCILLDYRPARNQVTSSAIHCPMVRECSLHIANRSSQYASSHIRNELPTSLKIHILSLSPIAKTPVHHIFIYFTAMKGPKFGLNVWSKYLWGALFLKWNN